MLSSNLCCATRSLSFGQGSIHWKVTRSFTLAYSTSLPLADPPLRVRHL